MYESYSEKYTGVQFMHRVFAWMAAGLGISATVAHLIGNSSYVYKIAASSGLLITLMLIQFALVVMLSGFIMQLSSFTAAFAFATYAFFTGITFSTLFLVYTQSSIAATFGIAAGMFAAMALYGYFTRADLSALHNILFMMLIGLILSGLINMFLQSSAFQMIISAFGVVIFCLLTAFDMQRIKGLSAALVGRGEAASKVAILCALTLYLDFINLFLYLLQFTGRRRD